jgi:hypothetical protein
MGAETQDSGTVVCLARAITARLQRSYPHHTAKYVARDLGCTPKAAANLLDGHLSTPSMGRLIRAYGAGWVAERVLEAAGHTLETYIDHQAAEAERAAARARERARDARSRVEKYQAARGGNPGRAGAQP